MRARKFDIVDIDPFGSPAPFLDSGAFCARKGLFLTATDRATLSGVHRKTAFRKYHALPLKTEYHAEVGLRILLYAVACSLARYGKAMIPLLSYSSIHYYRIFVLVRKGVENADKMLEDVGHILHCLKCGYREVKKGVCSQKRECEKCGEKLVYCGPIWIGNYKDSEFCGRVAEKLRGGKFNSTPTALKLLSRLSSELDIPTCYDCHLIARRLSLSPPTMEKLLDALTKEGYKASKTHYGGTLFKTDAPLDVIEDVLIKLQNKK
jgi:tRNA (guanine26-N2/guanine27-N2)-dimethyltransferase